MNSSSQVLSCKGLQTEVPRPILQQTSPIQKHSRSRPSCLKDPKLWFVLWCVSQSYSACQVWFAQADKQKQVGQTAQVFPEVVMSVKICFLKGRWKDVGISVQGVAFAQKPAMQKCRRTTYFSKNHMTLGSKCQQQRVTLRVSSSKCFQLTGASKSRFERAHCGWIETKSSLG